MKKSLLKVVSYVMMLAMVVTALVIPNVDAKAATDYYVAGEGAAFGGWAEADPNMKMTQDGDVYKFVIKDLPAGGYAFKITAGSWSNSWGKDGGNYTFETSATADLTIIFNPATTEIKVESTGLGAASYPDRYFAGEHNKWNVKDDSLKLTENADGSFSITIKMAAGKQDFKITNGTWGKTWPAENYALTLDAESNVTITVTKDGEVQVEKKAVENPAPAPAVTYHVLGLANDWTNADANKMTEVDGKYVYKVTLKAGDYEYKVHTSTDKWYPGGSNLKFTVETECEVTITFDTAKEEATVDGTGLKKEEVKYYLVGIDNVWDCKDENLLTLTDGKYVIKKTLKAGEYEYKVTSSTGKWYPAEGDNLKVKVEQDGDVTFTFDLEAGTIATSGDALKPAPAPAPETPPMGDLNMVPVCVVLFAGLALVSVAAVAKKKVA